MILPIILIILLSGALLAAVSGRLNKNMPLYITLATLLVTIGILLTSWEYSNSSVLANEATKWMYEFQCTWIPSMGTSIHLAIDGLSYIMILLTLVMGVVATLASTQIERKGFYFFNTLLLIAGVVGIFMAVDLFLFFFFWEMMLCPLYFLIATCSKENTEKAAFKFLIYTQASGLLMFLSILFLYFIHAAQTGIHSFDFNDLVNTQLSIRTASIIMFGFLAAFFVKLPVFPVHGWLPSTFKTAPATAILTGLLIKTGAYGIIRFAVPLFPEASLLFGPAAMILGVITILYAAFIAFSQNDIRLIAAYSGISHMGFIIIGLYAFNQAAWQGVAVQMVASAVSTSALILMAEALYKRTGTYDITKMGRLWEQAPVLSGLGMFFAMASLGLPGVANFIAEFLILAGTFKVSIFITVLASLGIVAAAAYSMRIVQKVFVGNKNGEYQVNDFNWIEKSTMAIMFALLIWIGLNPKPVLERSKPAIDKALTMPEKDVLPTEKGEPTSVSVKL
jgi:NADH-quinone oxidoreductase subunit M